MGRLALVLWIAWAVIVWNVVFDHVIVVAGRDYIAAALAARRRSLRQHGRLDAAGRGTRRLDRHRGAAGSPFCLTRALSLIVALRRIR